MIAPMNRRRFLSTTASVLALPALGPRQTEASPRTPTGIIDTHVHFYDPTRPQGVPWPDTNDKLLYRRILPNDFQQAAQAQGVEGVIVVEASKWFEDNQWVLEMADNDPFIVGFIGNVSPQQPQFAAQLARIVSHPLFQGLRIHTPSVGADLKHFSEMDKVLETIARWDVLPQMLELAAAYPSQRIVLDHFPLDYGQSAEKHGEQRQLLKELAQAPNIFLKISNVLRKRGEELVREPAAYTGALEALWELFGADRLVFGSNWPVSDRQGPYPVLVKVVSDFFAQKGPEAGHKYFCGNSRRIYRWTPRTEGQKRLLASG